MDGLNTGSVGKIVRHTQTLNQAMAEKEGQDLVELRGQGRDLKKLRQVGKKSARCTKWIMGGCRIRGRRGRGRRGRGSLGFRATPEPPWPPVSGRNSNGLIDDNRSGDPCSLVF